MRLFFPLSGAGGDLGKTKTFNTKEEKDTKHTKARFARG